MAKKKKGKSAKKTKQTDDFKFLGIALLIASVLVLLSFVILNSKNLLGPFGEVVARLLYLIIGKASYIIPFIIGFYGIAVLKGKEKYSESRYLIGLLLFIVTLSVFIALIAESSGNAIFKMSRVKEFYTKDMKNMWNEIPSYLHIMDSTYRFHAGGFIGNKVAVFLSSIFNVVGAYIISVILFGITVILFGKEEYLIKGGKVLHDVFVGLFKGIAKMFVVIGESLAGFFSNFRDSMDQHKKEIRREEKEQKKAEREAAKKEKALRQAQDKKAKVEKRKTRDEVDEDVKKGAEELKKKEAENNPKVEKKERRKAAVTVSSLELDAGERKPIQAVKGDYTLPSTELLKGGAIKSDKNIDYTEDADHLTKTLSSFGIKGEVVHIVDGPALARFDVELAIGTKVARVQALANDIALAMKVEQVRIAPVAGKSLLGIEVPKSNKQSIFLKELIEDEQFQGSSSLLTMALGRDLGGTPIIANLKTMPHLLVAGATGSGKSVCINTIIMSILYNASPDEVKLILVDPKRVELTHYRDLAHLLAPVITDVKKAAYVLKKLTFEMDYRYDMLSKEGAREIDAYNEMVNEYNEALKNESNGEEIPEEDLKKSLPYIVLIIDELADLMTLAKANVEGSLQRLAQLARAVGIHIILATQRPSVDVITGVIKANFPSRIAFQVMSHVDSRTIIDTKGAEALLGKGDMLYAPSEQNKPTRGQAAFVSTSEISKVVHFIKKQRKQEFSEEFDVKDDDPVLTGEKEDDGKGGGDSPLLQKAVDLAKAKGNISTSYLQRKLGIGYSKAARLIDDMEEKGLISEADGNKPRDYIGE